MERNFVRAKHVHNIEKKTFHTRTMFGAAFFSTKLQYWLCGVCVVKLEWRNKVRMIKSMMT